MNLLLILQVIVYVLRFPEEMRKFLLLLEKTPEEKRQEIAKKVNDELEEVLRGGRPRWD